MLNHLWLGLIFFCPLENVNFRFIFLNILTSWICLLALGLLHVDLCVFRLFYLTKLCRIFCNLFLVGICCLHFINPNTFALALIPLVFIIFSGNVRTLWIFVRVLTYLLLLCYLCILLAVREKSSMLLLLLFANILLLVYG